jgi:peptide/nickel transport system substrate-binding protein
VLRLAFDAADLKTLDPHFAAATMDRGVVDMIFNGLVRYRPGDINPDYIEPDLAESWEVSEDGLVWTFHLRQGVYFHPFPGHPEGYELTAEDVVYSLEKSADPARSAYAGEYAGMEFVAVDPLTVQIRLEQALSPGLFLPKVVDYAGGFIVCKRALEENGDEWFRTHPVGTGPFMFSSYTPMDRVVLVRNERYFRGAPILERIEVRYMPDVSARELGLRRGELDLVEGLREQPWVEKMEAVPGIVVDTFGPGETHVFHINMTQPPLDDLRVRQAIAYAISRDELVAFLGPRVCEPQYSAVPYQYLSGGLTPEELAERGLLYSVDRDKARELLAAAGYPNGFRIQAIITEMASYRRPTEAVQAQLREVGIDMQLQVVDHSTFHSLIREDASPLVMYEAWRPNADVFLTRFYHSDSIVVIGKKPDTNFSHYSQIDFPIEQARAELAPEVQAAWWKEAQIRILEDMAAHPLFVLKYVFARQPYVEYGYELRSCIALYPPINETTRILAH